MESATRTEDYEATNAGTLQLREFPVTSITSITPILADNTLGTAIGLTTSGGSGTGAVTFKVKGWGCLFDAKDRLIATGATVCIVTAKKAASTGYQATESESKTFTYTKK